MNTEMAKRNLHNSDIFFFFNAVFDPVALIKRYIRQEIRPSNEYCTNTFGTLR